MTADLSLKPTNPLASLYALSALTPAGEEFLDIWYPGQTHVNQEEKKRFEIVAWALGLKVETVDAPKVLRTMWDPE